MPPWYNRYFAGVQRKAFQRALSHCGDLAGASVLEIGCGTGRWSRLLRDLGAHVVAIDLSEEAIARNARTIAGIDFRAGDFLELELPEAAFDPRVVPFCWRTSGTPVATCSATAFASGCFFSSAPGSARLT